MKKRWMALLLTIIMIVTAMPVFGDSVAAMEIDHDAVEQEEQLETSEAEPEDEIIDAIDEEEITAEPELVEEPELEVEPEIEAEPELENETELEDAADVEGEAEKVIEPAESSVPEADEIPMVELEDDDDRASIELPSGGDVSEDIDYVDTDLLMANDFHIFSYVAETNVHVNGNIATGHLIGKTNFGTKPIGDGDLEEDIHYLQHIEEIASSSFEEQRKNKVVFGDRVEVETGSADDILAANDTDLFHLEFEEAFQDQDQDELYIDFDSVFSTLRNVSNTFMSTEESAGVIKNFANENRRTIDVSDVVTEYHKGDVVLQKTDGQGQPLAGAIFDLYQGDKLIEKNLETDEDGQIRLTDQLDVGDYFFKETEAPEGYVIEDNKTEFEITAENAGPIGYIYVDVLRSDLELARPLWITGLSSSKASVILNVDMQGATDIDLQAQIIPVIDGQERPNKETEKFSDAKFLWNFPNTTKNVFINKPFQGTILATNAYIEANQNIDGSMIADTVNVKGGESHRWDFQEFEGIAADPVEVSVVNRKIEEPTPEPTPEPEPEKIAVSGEKTWIDNDDAAGVRPESITIKLLKNGEVFQTKEVTAAEEWKWVFGELDEYEDGKKIEYTIEEELVEDYDSTVDGYDVTNEYNQEKPEKIEISGEKTWIDNDDEAGARPEFIVINLLKNGEVFQTKEVTVEDEWKWVFDELDEYEDGEEIEYTIEEESVEDYDSTVDGYDVTNEYNPEKIEISGEKTWIDNDDEAGARPEVIVINLLKNGEVFLTKEVTAKDDWKWVFDELDEYEDGKKIEYTIEEELVEDYDSTVDGYDVTNEYNPEDPEEPEIPDVSDTKDAKRPKPKEETDTNKPNQTNKETQPTTANRVTTTSGSRVSTATKAASKTTGSPKTGDNNQVGLWLGLLGVSTVVTTLITRNKKRKHSNQEQ